MIKIGIIREGKTPPDTRVALNPTQCAAVKQGGVFEIVVESSPNRCFSDSEFRAAGIEVVTDLSDCDVLLGVKEVPISQLLSNKTYFFFSHTIKKQPYNRKLLLAVLEKNIRLLDYEVLVDAADCRLIAFGKYAGMVGAHNALWTYAKTYGGFDLPRLTACHEYADAVEIYDSTTFPAVKIVVTGTGRVATGAIEVLRDMGIGYVTPEQFLANEFPVAVFTQLNASHYVRRKDGGVFVKTEFYGQPNLYESAFEPYARAADIFINGIFWNNDSPAFFTVEEMAQPDFRIRTIADVTCDIAPISSVPSTVRPSTIADPVYGFDPKNGEEVAPFSKDFINVMAVDNLPNELPRDASTFFGNQFLDSILHELANEPNSQVIARGIVAQNGQLMPRFAYLADYVGV